MNTTFRTQGEVTKEEKQKKVENFRIFHRDLIRDLDIIPSDFNVKMPFYDPHGRNVVGIFASEFKRPKGFFFELIDRDLEPIDSERTVYRIPHNESFEQEYEMNAKGSYLVPLEELRVVNMTSLAVSGPDAVLTEKISTKPISTYKAPAPIEDAPYAEMTIRDYVAIHTGRPVSKRAWLNELITKTK
jgi:hypothetical protein